MSLTDRIRNATSAAELEALLLEGKSYEFATNHTRNRWSRFAADRKAVLNSNK